MVDVALRLITFWGTLWLFGLPVVARLVLYPGFNALPDGSWRKGKALVVRSLSRTTWVALAAVGVGSIGLLLRQAAVLTALRPELGFSAAITSAVSERFGAVTALRAVAALALAVMLFGQLQHRLLARITGPAALFFWILWGVLAGCLVLSLPLTGHAGVSPQPVLATTLDTAHIMAAGVWVAGVLTLAQSLLWAFVGRGRHAQLKVFAPVLARFAALAPAAIAAAGLTGVLTTTVALDAWSEFTTSPYGITLLVKILLFGVILALGGVNHFWLLRRLRSPQRREVEFRAEYAAVTVLRVELLFGFVVLVLTGVLTGLPRPG